MKKITMAAGSIYCLLYMMAIDSLTTKQIIVGGIPFLVMGIWIFIETKED